MDRGLGELSICSESDQPHNKTGEETHREGKLAPDHQKKKREWGKEQGAGWGCSPKIAVHWDDTGILLCQLSSFAIKEKKNPLHKSCPERRMGHAGFLLAEQQL